MLELKQGQPSPQMVFIFWACLIIHSVTAQRGRSVQLLPQTITTGIRALISLQLEDNSCSRTGNSKYSNSCFGFLSWAKRNQPQAGSVKTRLGLDGSYCWSGFDEVSGAWIPWATVQLPEQEPGCDSQCLFTILCPWLFWFSAWKVTPGLINFCLGHA